jgi:DNA-binding NarL/FixJ family response regulator
MSPLERLLLTHRLLPQQFIRLEAELFVMLENLAGARGQTVQAFASAVLQAVVDESRAQTQIERQWETLTPRERQVTALICLGYKNSEIAYSLTISINTVRSHTRSILDKFGISSKAELRLVLAKWDFVTWLASQETPDALQPGSSLGTSPLV